MQILQILLIAQIVRSMREGFHVHSLTRPKLPGLCGFFSQVFLNSTRKNFRMDPLAAVSTTARFDEPPPNACDRLRGQSHESLAVDGRHSGNDLMAGHG